MATPLDVAAGMKSPLNAITTEIELNSKPTKIKKTNLHSERGVFDTLILIFNEYHTLNIYHWFYWLWQYFPVIVQVAAATFSPFIIDLWPLTDPIGKIVRIFSCFISFSPKTMTNQSEIAPGIILSLIYLLIAGFYIGIHILLSKSPTIPKPVLYISAFLSEIVSPLLNLCFSIHFGLCGYSLSLSPEWGPIIAFIFDLVGYLTCLAINFLFANLNSFLVNPTRSPICTYSGFNAFAIVFSMNVYIFLALLTYNLAHFLVIGVAVIHIAVLVGLIIDVFNYPYVHTGTNYFAAALNSFTISGHLLTIIGIAGVKIPSLIRLIIPVAVFFVAFIVFGIILHKQRNKIIGLLSNTDAKTETEKNEYFLSLGIGTGSASKIRKYLNVGFSALPPLILDFSFLIYISEKVPDKAYWTDCALFVCFFPGEQQALKYFVDHLNERTMSNFKQKYCSLRLKEFYLKRFFSNSEESNVVYEQLKAESQEAYLNIKTFWKSISDGNLFIHQSDIENISTQIMSCNKHWKSTIELNPNDSRFTSGYADFLLEAFVSVEKGAMTKIKGTHLLKGLHTDVDPLFRAFAVARPFIIHKKLLDKNGNIKRSSFEISTTGQTTTISTTALQKLEEDLDAGAADQLISSLYEWPHLRKSLSRATSNYKPQFLSIGIIFQLIGVFIMMALLIVSAVFVLGLVDHYKLFSDRINSVYDLRVNFATAKLALSLKWAKETNQLFTQASYDLTLDAAAQAEKSLFNPLSFEKEFQRYLIYATESSMNITKSFSTALLEAKNGSVLVKTFTDNVVARELCDATGNVQFGIVTSIKNSISTLTYLFLRLAGDFNDPTVFQTFGQNIRCCQTYALQNNLHYELDKILNYTIDDIEARLDSDRSTIVIFLIVLVVVFFICIPLLSSPLITTSISFNKLLKALLSVNSETAKEATKKIVKIENSDISTQSSSNVIVRTNQGNHSSSIQTIIIAFLWVVAFALILFCSIRPLDGVTFLSDLSLWLIDGGRRLPYAIETTAQIGYYLNSKAGGTNFATPTDIYAYASTLLNKLIESEIIFFSGDHGIKGQFTDIDKFHTEDSCESSTSTEGTHVLYKCFGVERLFSTFTMQVKNMETTLDMTKDNWIHLLHMTITEMNNLLSSVQLSLVNHIDSQITNQKIETITVTIVIILLFWVMVLLMDLYIRRSIKNSKTCLILLRHLPPPALAENEQITNILLGNNSEVNDLEKSSALVVFENLPTPVICISSDCTIESMNNSSKNLFGYVQGQIIGQKLDCLIERISEEDLANRDSVTETENGSYEMYKNIKIMSEPGCNDFTYTLNISCRCADDSLIPCEVTLHGVVEFSGVASNFVLFIKDTREETKIKKETQLATEALAKLQNQLIPRDVQGFIRDDRTDFSFTTPHATVVAIVINDFFDKLKGVQDLNNPDISINNPNNMKSNRNLAPLVKLSKANINNSAIGSKVLNKQGFSNEDDFFNAIHQFYTKIESACIRNPPMMKQKIISNTLIAIGGLFSEKGMTLSHGQAALGFVNEALEIAHKDNWDISVGVATGGPLLCGLVGTNLKSFDAAGAIVEEAIDLAENTNDKKVIVSQATKDIAPDIEMDKFMILNGKQVYTIRNSN